jgi:hypothetical protein
LLIGISFSLYQCQKADDTTIPEENAESEIAHLKAFNLTAENTPSHILDFIRTKTNNRLSVSISKDKIKLSSSEANEYSRQTPLGIVQTNKVIQVYNERNTKYTFKVSDPSNVDNVINLIVVDMDGDIIEYFIQYVFDPNIDPPRLSSGAIDMARFTGATYFYDNYGNNIGSYILTDGSITNTSGETNPCDEDINDSESTDDDENNNSGGGAQGSTDPNDTNNTNDDGSNSNSGSGAGALDNGDEDDCGLSFSYQCDGGVSGDHQPTRNDNLPTGQCSGAGGQGNAATGIIIIKDCYGNIISSRTSGTLEPSPCDGPTAVLIDEELVSLRNDCNKLEALSSSPDFQNKMEEILAGTSGSTEIGYYGRKNEDGEIEYLAEDRHESDPDNVEIATDPPATAIDSDIHNHFNDGLGSLSVFSGADLYTTHQLFYYDLIENNNQYIKVLATPGDNISPDDDTVYALKIKGGANFNDFGLNYLNDPLIADVYFKEKGIVANNSTAQQEKLLVELLNELDSGLVIYRGDKNNLNNWTQLKINNNGNFEENDCKD